MKIAIINGSPKVKDSNTQYLLGEIKNIIENNNEVLEFNIKKNSLSQDQLENIYTCDVLIFGFPLYVDSIPSHMLSCLSDIEDYFKPKRLKDFKVYTIVNCGFYEGNQNQLAIEIMKNWCQKARLDWGQGIGCGGGEMIRSIKSVPLGHGPKKDLGKAINTLCKNILEGDSGESIFVSPNFPKILFRICANTFWKVRAKENGIKKRDIIKK